MLRVLIISRTPWNISNSFGNTFSNIFEGMEGVEIYNICCQSGDIDNNIVKDTLQLSESSLLRRKAWNNSKELHRGQNEDAVIIESFQNYGKKKRPVWMFVARDFIWTLTSKKWKKEIDGFINFVKPDILYIPVYASWYMCDVDRYVVDKLEAPTVLHVSDDVYGYPPNLFSVSLKKYYRLHLRCKIKELMKRASYVEVFAENMQEAYEKEFGVPCYVIGKGIKPDNVRKGNDKEWQDEVHFVYTGGVAGERINVLIELGRSLTKCEGGKNYYLDIYSATPLAEKTKAEINSVSSIVFHGAVSGKEVKDIQAKADALVHVEGFSDRAIFETAMSFSTKIIDYLSTGNLLLAIGPQQINSIQVLKKYNMAVVIDKVNNIDCVLGKLFNGQIDIITIKENAYNFLITKRDLTVIQNEIYERMKNVCYEYAN